MCSHELVFTTVSKFPPSLRLSWCHLTQKCCNYIGTVLSSAHLRELDLTGNNLRGPGIQLLCAGLTSPQCKLETLR